MSKTTHSAAWVLGCGILFGAGLVISGMADPAKVLGFLNVAAIGNGISFGSSPGLWDPSLALVMAGALGVTVPGFAFARKRMLYPLHARQFDAPSKLHIDKPLLAGSATFGLGWGLAGYCPGPALVSLTWGGADAWTFGLSMLGAMALTQHGLRARQRRAT